MISNNKNIIVTGAGNGMGRALALLLVSKGAKVAAIDINESGLQETTSLVKGEQAHLKTYVLDITNRQKVEETVDTIITDFGTIDGIINNAGIIQPFVRVNELELSAIERVMNVNFYGTLYLIKALLPHLLQRPEAHIVNISSMGGFLPVPGQTVYGASKAAVKILTEGLYSELAETKVKVSVVFPGAVATNITANSGLGAPSAEAGENHRALPAGQAAEIIIRGMEADKFRILVGKDAGFLDKLYRFHPRYATDFIRKKMRDLLG